MSEFPVAPGSEAIRAFQHAGFVLERIEGSHHHLKKPGHLYILTVPVHRKKALKRGTLRRLIRDSGLTVAEFNDLLAR